MMTNMPTMDLRFLEHAMWVSVSQMRDTSKSLEVHRICQMCVLKLKMVSWKVLWCTEFGAEGKGTSFTVVNCTSLSFICIYIYIVFCWINFHHSFSDYLLSILLCPNPQVPQRNPGPISPLPQANCLLKDKANLMLAKRTARLRRISVFHIGEKPVRKHVERRSKKRLQRS